MKLRSELARIKYVREQFFQFLHDFNHIINRITEMSEIDKIEKFTNGLRGNTVKFTLNATFSKITVYHLDGNCKYRTIEF